MKLTILGSGTFVIESKRSCPSYLIEDKNTKIVLDFGLGTLQNLLKLKIDPYDLDNIFITHMHVDHASELVSFISLIIYAPDKSKLKKRYNIYGPKGIKRDISHLLKSLHMNKHLSRFVVKEITNPIRINNIQVKPFKIKHGKIPSLAFRLISNNKAICYTGDTEYCSEVIKACNNVDLAIIEATAPKEWNLKDHLTGEQVGKIAQEANVKKLIATHIARPYLKDVKRDIQKNYKGNVFIAKDLLEVKI